MCKSLRSMLAKNSLYTAGKVSKINVYNIYQEGKLHLYHLYVVKTRPFTSKVKHIVSVE